MAEPRFQLSLNGQELQQGDVNTIGKVAGLADDRVLAELWRMPTYNGSTVSKMIVPFSNEGKTALNAPGAWLDWGTGSINVNPFRVLIGSRSTVATSPSDNWRDTRSTICIGSSNLYQSVSFVANSTIYSRWDLVYVAVTPDANAPGVTRYVKDPTTLIVSAQTVFTILQTTQTLAVVTGTPANAGNLNPPLPALPADAAGTYYVPICYVLIPAGFTTTTAVNVKSIYCVAPIMPQSPQATGNMAISPSTSQYTNLNSASTNGIIGWAESGGVSRPNWYISPEATGG